MKKAIISLALLVLIATHSFAQNTFTEAMFSDFMKGYANNDENYWKNHVVPDFMFVGTGGMVANKEQFMAFAKGGNTFLSEFSNVKVRQYGNTAIVTGIWKHGHHITATNRDDRYNEIFTANYQEQNGKWKMLSLMMGEAPKEKADEEAAIKVVLEKETTTWNARKLDEFVSCWANVPYALQLVAHGEMQANGGVAYGTNEKANLPETVKAMFVGMGKPDGSIFKNEGYVIRINGNSAFAYYDQTVTATDGKKNTFHEARYLEKVNLEWKIVYVGAVKYPLFEK